VTPYYVYLVDSLEYVGAVEAADPETAGQLAEALWPGPLRLLTWRLRLTQDLAH
jgi:hypothetical protein